LASLQILSATLGIEIGLFAICLGRQFVVENEASANSLEGRSCRCFVGVANKRRTLNQQLARANVAADEDSHRLIDVRSVFIDDSRVIEQHTNRRLRPIASACNVLSHFLGRSDLADHHPGSKRGGWCVDRIASRSIKDPRHNGGANATI
jgi:hypothetical protein